MNTLFIRIVLISLLFPCYSVLCQDTTIDAFREEYYAINTTSMGVLGSWALLNITTGIYGSLHSQEDKKAFWQMNAGWNIINIAIAGFGYYAKPELYDFQSAIHQQSSIQQFLALNIGLDIAYMLGGLYLKEKSNTTSQAHLLGFGNSLIVQGAFLLLFDCVLYTTHHQHGKHLESMIKHIYPLSSGIGCSIPF